MALSQTVPTDEDVPVTVTLAGTDADGDPLTYEILTQPAHGEIKGTPQSLTYQPNLNYYGTDHLTFRVSDGLFQSAPATVTLQVDPVNDCPDAVLTIKPDCKLSTRGGEWVVIAGNGTNACVVLDATLSSDVEGDALTFAWRTTGSVLPFATGSLVTHCFEVGNHELTLVANDGQCDGSTTAMLRIVTPGYAVEELIAEVNAITAGAETTRPLVALLERVGEDYERNRFDKVAGTLRLFQKLAQLRLGRDYPMETAALIDRAEAILNAIERENLIARPDKAATSVELASLTGGTDPAGAPSGLRITKLEVIGQKLWVTFPTVVGYEYGMDSSTDLQNWTFLGWGNPGTGEDLRMSVSGGPQLFVRVRARLLP